jgi:hypothetical protein
MTAFFADAEATIKWLFKELPEAAASLPFQEALDQHLEEVEGERTPRHVIEWLRVRHGIHLVLPLGL